LVIPKIEFAAKFPSRSPGSARSFFSHPIGAPSAGMKLTSRRDRGRWSSISQSSISDDRRLMRYAILIASAANELSRELLSEAAFGFRYSRYGEYSSPPDTRRSNQPDAIPMHRARPAPPPPRVYNLIFHRVSITSLRSRAKYIERTWKRPRKRISSWIRLRSHRVSQRFRIAGCM